MVCCVFVCDLCGNTGNVFLTDDTGVENYLLKQAV